jgi:hypothetical protein
MTRGQAGGLACYRKYGREHYVQMRRKWGKKYKWVPLATYQWALIIRATGEAVAFA